MLYYRLVPEVSTSSPRQHEDPTTCAPATRGSSDPLLSPTTIKVPTRSAHIHHARSSARSQTSRIGGKIGAALVAEGIEVELERKCLVDLGIEFGQGFLLGRPSFQVNGRASRG